MFICKNDIKRTYKGIEPSPKGLGYCSYKEDIGKVMKGKDGNNWIVIQTKNGLKNFFKNIKKLNYKSKSFNIDNINYYVYKDDENFEKNFYKDELKELND